MFNTRVSEGVGVDAVEPARLQQRLERNPSLEAELFTVGERAYCASQARPIEHLAVRFCAKEAVVKALALDGFDPLEVEVLDPAPAPVIQLHGDVAARAAALGVHVVISLTHLESIAIAVAIAERRRPLTARALHAIRSLRRTSR
jgi:holo-[acyl-carrier protein] synthase